MIHWIRYRYGIRAPVLNRSEELTVKELARRFQIGIDVVHYLDSTGAPDGLQTDGDSALLDGCCTLADQLIDGALHMGGRNTLSIPVRFGISHD